jgi:hypothetical protein
MFSFYGGTANLGIHPVESRRRIPTQHAAD